jgi:hypothetical protein
VKAIFEQIIGEMPKVAFTVQLTPNTADLLVNLQSRQIQQFLREAIGHVLLRTSTTYLSILELNIAVELNEKLNNTDRTYTTFEYSARTAFN